VKALEVTGVVVGDAVFPATKSNANPLEGERSHSGVVARPAFALLFIISPSPATKADGVAGPFLECLTQELRTSPTIVNPGGLPAAYQDRGDATELLYFGRRLISVSLRTEGRQQARRHHRTSARE